MTKHNTEHTSYSQEENTYIENTSPQILDIDAELGEFNDLFEEVYSDLKRYATAVAESEMVGEDILMEAWWEVLERFPNFENRHPIPFKVYFHRVIRSKYSSHIKRRIRERSADIDILNFYKKNDEGFADKFLPEYLHEAISCLEPIYQRVMLFEAEGYSEEQGADLLNLTVDEYLEILEEARYLLQEKLSSKEEEETTNSIYLSIFEAADITDKHWTWIKHNLKDLLVEFNSKIEEGEEKFCFNREALELISERQKQSPQPAEEWLTIYQMEAILGIYSNWIARRIGELSVPGEYRISVKGKTLVHFPPECLEELMGIRDNYDKIPVYSDKEYNKKGLANILNRHHFWVKSRLKEMEIKGFLRKDSMGKVIRYYSEDVLEKLKEESEKYKDRADWVAIPTIAEELGKDRSWVENRIESLEIEGELREEEINKRVFLYYDPKIIERLRPEATAYEESAEGWLTKTGLRKKVGKSRNWINRRLEVIVEDTKPMLDSQGVVRDHYPPHVLEKLKIMRRKQEEKKSAKKWYER